MLLPFENELLLIPERPLLRRHQFDRTAPDVARANIFARNGEWVTPLSNTMSANACTGWDNSECEESRHCPPRCPWFVNEEGTPVLIRPYGLDRRDALLEMYDTVESSTMGLPPEQRDDRERWIDRLESDGWNLIATVGDEIVGHVAVVPAAAVDSEFVVFVRPDFQNRGIGSGLLEHVIARADDRDHDELNLNVSKDRLRAIAVYEKIGFSVTNVNRIDIDMRLPLVTAVRRPPAARD